jgi:parallel beta-helix repeat protein
VAGTLFVLPKQAPLNVGAVVPGAKLYFYLSGTSTPVATYTTPALDVEHASPVVADADGVFAPIYLDSGNGEHRIKLTDAADVQLWQVDSVPTLEIYGRTAAEIAAGVTPVDYARIVTPIRDLSRYVSDNTGAVDVTSQFNAALQSGLDVLEVPEGTYKITGRLLVPSGVHLRGQGRRSIIEAGANVNGYLYLNGVSDVRLENFLLDGKRATYTTQTNFGIYGPANGTGCTNVELHDVWVERAGGSGIIFLAQTGSHSKKIKIMRGGTYDTGGHGIICQDYVDDVEIAHTDVRDFGMVTSDRPGITLGRSGARQRCHHNTVVGSASAVGSSVHGISADGTTEAEVDHNIVSDCIGYGIEIGGVLGGAITSNHISRCSRSGIAMSGLQSESLRNEYVTIVANGIENCGTTGDGGLYSFVSGGSGAVMHKAITIAGNIIRNCAGIGMNFGMIDELLISDNQVKACGHSGIYMIDCKNIQIDNNKIIGNNTLNSASHGGIRVLSYTLSADQRLRWGINQVHDSLIADYYPGTFITTFASLDTTPSVKRGRTFQTANASATVISAFDDGVEGDEIFVLIDDANTTIDFTGTTLKGNGGADKVCTSGDFLRARLMGGNWYCDFVDA